MVITAILTAAPRASAFVVAPSAVAVGAASRHLAAEGGGGARGQQHARGRSAGALRMVAQPPVKQQKVCNKHDAVFVGARVTVFEADIMVYITPKYYLVNM